MTPESHFCQQKGNVRLRQTTRAIRIQVPAAHRSALRRPRIQRAQPHRRRARVHRERSGNVYFGRAAVADWTNVVPGTVRAAQPRCEDDRFCGSEG